MTSSIRAKRVQVFVGRGSGDLAAGADDVVGAGFLVALGDVGLDGFGLAFEDGADGVEVAEEYGVGAGGISAGLLFVASFVIRLLLNSFFDVPLQTERTLPGPPGTGIALAFVLAAAFRYAGDRLPLLSHIQPTTPALRPLSRRTRARKSQKSS